MMRRSMVIELLVASLTASSFCVQGRETLPDGSCDAASGSGFCAATPDVPGSIRENVEIPDSSSLLQIKTGDVRDSDSNTDKKTWPLGLRWEGRQETQDRQGLHQPGRSFADVV